VRSTSEPCCLAFDRCTLTPSRGNSHRTVISETSNIDTSVALWKEGCNRKTSAVAVPKGIDIAFRIVEPSALE
jgi:hypothetical protein